MEFNLILKKSNLKEEKKKKRLLNQVLMNSIESRNETQYLAPLFVLCGIACIDHVKMYWKEGFVHGFGIHTRTLTFFKTWSE